MSTRATGTFDIETWDEKPCEEQEGARLTRTHVSKTFHGDVEGESTAELLMAYAAVEGSAAYVGFERIVGHVHGRPGSFVLHHIPRPERVARGQPRGPWCRIPEPANCAGCVAMPGSPSSRTAGTPSRSTTTSRDSPMKGKQSLVGSVR